MPQENSILYGTRHVSEYGFALNGKDPYDGPAIYAEKVFAEIGKNPNVNTSLPKTMMAFKSMMEGTN